MRKITLLSLLPVPVSQLLSYMLGSFSLAENSNHHKEPQPKSLKATWRATRTACQSIPFTASCTELQKGPGLVAVPVPGPLQMELRGCGGVAAARPQGPAVGKVLWLERTSGSVSPLCVCQQFTVLSFSFCW